MKLKIGYLYLTEGRQGEGRLDDLLVPGRGTPYFFNIDLKTVDLGMEKMELDGVMVETKRWLFGEKVLVSESIYEIETGVGNYVEINEKIRKSVVDKYHNGDTFSEEYTLILKEAEKKPEEWLKKNQTILANLIRSADKPLEKGEIESVLRTRIRYSTTDLVTIDWDGGVLVEEAGDFKSDIDLVKVANFQLLRYRLIDRELKKNLLEVKSLVDEQSWLPGKNNLLRKLVNRRLEIITELEELSQSLLLIGDWYSAQVYQALFDELYIADWKQIVADKLDSLGSIYESVTQNLSFSWERLFDLVSVFGWGILLIGYFVLFIFDVYRIK